MATLTMLMAFLTLVLHVNATPGSALSPTYYDGLCISSDGTPGTKKFQDTADLVVKLKVTADSTLIAALLRLVFHEGFVRGADASILLDSTPGNVAEKDGPPNVNSLRGYEVIDAVKDAMEQICPNVISCADILQESARAAMKNLALGSLEYDLQYGRRDLFTSLASEAAQELPEPIDKYHELLSNFADKGFNATELIILSGAHTIGFSRCSNFEQRLYNFSGNGDTDPALDSTFAITLKLACPENAVVDGVVVLDSQTPVTFDNQYYQNILIGKALFTSDNELKVGDPTGVARFVGSAKNDFFRAAFKKAIVKLSEVQVKLYPQGEIRKDCKKRN